MEESTRHVKVMVPLRESGTKIESELLWAVDLGGDAYQVDNCPFFVYHISLGDILYAKKCDEGKPLVFEQIVSKSGNRTLRIIFEAPHKEGNITAEILESIKNFGCGYEGYNDRYFSINVPPAVNYGKLCEYLIGKGIEWEDADKY